ncbi:MAG TPA: heme o synthase [Fibrobacteria bacterium]|nr:heme o synthase [Fibrobacteria bacterium]
MKAVAPVSAASGAPSASNAPHAIASFFELMKLKMVFHILITTFVGYYLGSKVEMAQALLWHTLLGTGLLAIGAFALNQAIEKDYDKLMERTRTRPIPTERVGRTAAVVFGCLCFLVGTAYLWIYVNALTAFLGGLTLVLYAAVYTPMKRMSSLNTLVGAIPGALPPLMGWTAAQDSLGLGGMILAAILFFWQLPHFLALALMYKDDYRLGGFKMLSVTDPTGEACFRHIIVQTLILVLVSLFPFVFRFAGPWYLATASIGGGYFLLSAISLARRRNREAARALFFTSLAYLPVLLLVMAWDKAILFV